MPNTKLAKASTIEIKSISCNNKLSETDTPTLDRHKLHLKRQSNTDLERNQLVRVNPFQGKPSSNLHQT